jgi:hypothetical protein
MLMKKALLIALVLGLVVAVAAPALAVNLMIKGQFAIKGEYYTNIDKVTSVGVDNYVYAYNPPFPNASAGPPLPTSAAWNEENAWIQQRTIMALVAVVNKDLYGALVFEIDSDRWGSQAASTSLPAPTIGGAAGSGRSGAWGTDQIAVEVKNAYINFKVPQVPVTIKAGLQNFAVRPHLCLLKDGAGLSAVIEFKTDPVTIAIKPLWAKMLEDTDHTDADDWDLYGIDLNLAFGDIQPGVFFLYQDMRERYGAPMYGDSHMYWIGPYVDAKIGPVDVTFDFIYSGGKEDYEVGTDLDHDGWVLRGEVGYTLNKLRVGIGGLYGTGDDRSDADDDDSYRVPYLSEAAAANKDFLILTGDWVVNAPYGFSYAGSFFKPFSDIGAGVWYVRAFADYQLLSWLTLSANMGYIGDTTEGHGPIYLEGDTFGRSADDNDSIGWEMDIGTAIDIYKNLKWSVAFGYLIAGDALNSMGDKRPDDPWALCSTLVYSF